MVGKKVFCLKKKPSVTVQGKADKKKFGSGAQCTAECIQGVTTTPAPTTAGPQTPCIDCYTENGVLCQFPFTFDNKTYTSCTQAGNSSQAWCSTKVDQFHQHISGIGEWGYCSADCPSDSGYPASGAGPP